MEEKKLHILKNVGKLYFKFGIRAVTMDDVAAEIGISKKTLYQYFSDKEDLVEQVIDYYLESPEMNPFKTNAGNAIDRYFVLRQHVSQMLKHLNNNIEFELKKTYPSLYKKLYKIKRKKIYDDTVQNIKSGIEDGILRADLDPDVIGKLHLGRILLTLNPEFEVFSEDEVSKLELFDKVMDYHIHGICTEKGLNYYRKQLNKFQNEEQN